MSISSAAGGLPLGIVVTSAESADVVCKRMATLKELFPDSVFYGRGYPTNFIIDDWLRGFTPNMAKLEYLCMHIPLSTKYVEMAFMQ